MEYTPRSPLRVAELHIMSQLIITVHTAQDSGSESKCKIWYLPAITWTWGVMRAKRRVVSMFFVGQPSDDVLYIPSCHGMHQVSKLHESVSTGYWHESLTKFSNFGAIETFPISLQISLNDNQ